MSEPRPKEPVQRPLTVWLLALVLAILALGGAMGAWMFLMHPDGKGIGMEETLAKLPVSSFLLPGVFLLSVMCVLPSLLLLGLLVRPTWAWLDPVSRRTGMHWSWVGSVGLGLVIVVWLSVQTVFIGFSAPAQYFTAVLGAGVLLFALLPPTRRALRR